MISKVVQGIIISAFVFFFLMIVVAAYGQDVPPFPQIDSQKMILEVGRLQLQLSNAQEYIGTLQAKIQEQAKEIAALKAARP